MARAQGALAQAQGQMDYAKSQLEATVIRAPVNGTILDRTAEKGELITSQFASSAAGGPQGSPLSMADLNDSRGRGRGPDLRVSGIRPRVPDVLGNRRVKNERLLLDERDVAPNVIDGQIAQISPEANRQKATVQVKVQVLNPGKYPDVQLRPEMNATVRFLANETAKDAKGPAGIFVPSTAIRDRDGKKVVYIAYSGKAVAREIHVTSRRADGALVDGLVGGESVITTAPTTLKDGDKIKIKGQS